MQYKPGNWVTGFKRSPRAANVQHRDMGLFLNSSGKFEPIDDSWDNLHSGGLFISDDNKLYFRDETNKDIYINSPAAETLGLSAGNATTAGFVTINEEGFDTDFRVEASGVANALFVQGSDGFVGIGTGSPNVPLDVEYDSTGSIARFYNSTSTGGADNVYLAFQNADTGTTLMSDGSLIGIDTDNSLTLWNFEAAGFKVGTTSTTRFSIAAGGDITVNTGSNLGIGAAPGTLLELFGTAPYLTLRNSTHEDGDGGRESKIIFEGEQSGGEDSTLAVIQASHDGTSDDEKGDLIFSTNDGDDAAAPTEAMRIDSAGNVGIGQPNPSTRQLQTLASSTNGLRVENSTNDVIVDVLAATSQAWVGTISAHDLVLLAEGTSTLTIGTSGDCTIANGNLVIGTAGKGIDFSNQASPAAGMTSELLDHYEEGTFTPVVSDLTNTATMNGSYDTCNYVKIGRTVFWNGFLTMTSKGSLSGSLALTGFPFAKPAGNENAGAAVIGYFTGATGLTTAASLSLYMSETIARCWFTVTDGTATITILQDSEITDTFGFIVSGFYSTS